MKRVRWGVLGSAMIALERVVPAMQASPLCDVTAIASRSPARAEAAAKAHGIERAYGSYESLLADPDVEAIYNPLPNHLHLEWTTKALAAGKHVLCEKPIAMNASEAMALIRARDESGCLVEEAFMVRDHPQWDRLHAMMREPSFGQLRSAQLSYAYFNVDENDIRNSPASGGGGLYDLGCYCCAVARLIFQSEPVSVFANWRLDERFGVDWLTSAILNFEQGQASLMVSTQSTRYQLVQVLGTEGWVRVEVPFAHPETLGARLVRGINQLPGTEAEEIVHLEPVNQYRLQGERFSRLIRGAEPARSRPLEDAAANMRVLDALRESAETGRVVELR